MMSPPRLSLRVLREALQAATRETLRLCRLSKPAQAGLEPQAPAPRGPFFPWGGPAEKYGPHACRYAYCAAPEGAFFPWGGPAEK